MSDELRQRLIDIFLVNGAVTIEETESENFQLAINDVAALFEKQIQGVLDANGQTP